MPLNRDRRLKTKWGSIALLSVCEVLALAVWFAQPAVIPALRLEFALTGFQESLFSSSAIAGIVAGTLASAALGLADRVPPHRFFMISAFVAAGANAATAMFHPASPVVVLLRFLVGLCFAGLYPVGMLIAATWAKRDTGLLLGTVIGAVVLGAAAPHFFDIFSGLDWRATLAVASLASMAGGLLVHLVALGDARKGVAPFIPSAARRAWTHVPLRLVNAGYMGHMWELYPMWAWVGVFLHASFEKSLGRGGADVELYANVATFAVIGIGALGCFLAGYFADRLGRTTLTMLSLAVSGTCAAAAGLLFGGNPWLLVGLCLIWGIAVPADSAQFSACAVELAEGSIVGTMLTVQTCAGFLVSLFTVHMIPPLVETLGWRWAMLSLAVGPLLGFGAMWRLRRHPAAQGLANGNR